MKVLFVIPATGYYTRALSNPLGVLSIATYLKTSGHEVKILDRNVDDSNLNNIIKSFSPDITGVSVMSSRCLKDAQLVSKIIKKFGLTVVWGGQMPTMQAELCLQCKYVDYIMMGEGELTWLELVSRLESHSTFYDIDGMAYRNGGEVTYTKCRKFADLKNIPIIDWTLVNPSDYFQKYFHSERMLYLFSSKGCPCNCSFCGNINFHRCKHRKRPNSMVIEEIENLVKNYGMDAFYFTDELWSIDKDDMYEFCRMLKEKNLDVVWGFETRIGMYNREDYQTLYDANCRWILFGVESGSKEMLKRIHKGISVEAVEESIQICEDVGITSATNFIVGFPDETEDEVCDTVKLAMKIPSKLQPFYHFFPTPGSAFYDELIDRGLYTPPKKLNDVEKVIATESLGKNFSKVPSRDLRVIRSFFHWASFTRKDAINESEPFAFAKQAIVDAFKSITKKGIIYFFVGGFKAAFEFLYVFWNVTMYPKTRRKYGLFLKDKR